MRLKLIFHFHDLKFEIRCSTARVDWSKNEILCFIPINLMDINCCTYELIYKHDIRDFSKIEAEIYDQRYYSIFSGSPRVIYRAILEKIDGEMVETSGHWSYLLDNSLTEEKINRFERIEKEGKVCLK